MVSVSALVQPLAQILGRQVVDLNMTIYEPLFIKPKPTTNQSQHLRQLPPKRVIGHCNC